MNQNIVKNILANNQKGEQRELMDWMLYDSILLATASANQTVTLFQNTVGSVGIARTNMKSAGMLPSPQSFIVTGITLFILNSDGTPFFFAGGAAPTVHPANVIFNQLTWKLRVDPSTDYEGAGFEFWDPIDYQNDTGTTLGVASSLTTKKWKEVKFKAPILLAANRAFSLEANFTTPAAATGYSITKTLLYAKLTGLLRRNV
jgi:hypothetical protein